MFTFLGVYLTLGGIIIAFVTLKRPRRVVLWSLITLIIMQGLSFLIFSGILSQSILFLWLMAGMIAGVVCGLSIKLQLNGKNIFYHQNIVFAFSYMFLLLINQLIVLLFKVYLPVMLILAALAAGMQIGYNLTIVVKCKRTTAIKMGMLVLLLIAFLPAAINLTTVPASAGGDLSGRWTYKNTSIDASQVPDICWSQIKQSTGFEKSEVIQRATGPYIDEFFVLNYQDGKYFLERRHPDRISPVEFTETLVDGNRVQATLESPSFPNWKIIVEAQISGADVAGNIILYGYTIYTSAEGDKYSYPLIINFTAGRELPGPGSSSTPGATGTADTPGATGAGQGDNNPQNKQSNNPFIPQTVSSKAASAAVAVSGVLAGISALVSTVAALFGAAVSSTTSVPITGTGSAPNVPDPGVPQMQSAPASEPIPETPPSPPETAKPGEPPPEQAGGSGEEEPVTGHGEDGGDAGEEGEKEPESPGSRADLTPEQLAELKSRMDQVIKDKIKEGYFVRNPGVAKKIFWNFPIVGKTVEWAGGWQGGQCGEYGEWGAQWSEKFIREVAGDNTIITTITLERNSLRNHRATKIIMPSGERYVLDYWESMTAKEARIYTEQEWTDKWKKRLGGKPSVVENSVAETILKNYIDKVGVEKGIDLFRQFQKNKGLAESVIRSYRRAPW